MKPEEVLIMRVIIVALILVYIKYGIHKLRYMNSNYGKFEYYANAETTFKGFWVFIDLISLIVVITASIVGIAYLSLKII